jgi:lipid-A-disaccharide synthase
LPVVCGAARLIHDARPGAKFMMVLPTEELKKKAAAFPELPGDVRVSAGPVADALKEADLAITKSGTITQECALFGVPAVVFYRTSWPTYFAARMLVQVPFVAMPNLLAGRAIYPELLQHDATPEQIANTALALLEDRTGLAATRLELLSLMDPLRKRGSSQRAARAILRLLD